MFIKKTLASAALAALLAAPALATTQDYSFTGSLSGDDDVQLFTFTVGSTSTVTLRTWSYAGGTNAEGLTISGGGFDPILALFGSTGTLIDQNDDGGCSLVGADATTGRCWDTYLSVTLDAGTYTVSVSQYSNFAVGPNLSDGFDGSGQTNFGGRTSSWAFDLLNVESAVVNQTPEPASLALVLSALGIAALRRRRS